MTQTFAGWTVLAILACSAGGCGRSAGNTDERPVIPESAGRTGVLTPGALPFLNDQITAPELSARVNQFAPSVLDFDDRSLQAWEKQVLKKLVEASFVLHDVYALQVSENIPEWRARIEREQGDGKQAAIDYFEIMVGPWDRLAHDQPFLEVGPKPPGAAYYPLDLTKAEFEAHLAKHAQDRTAFTGYFTVIRRDAQRNLKAVPYSEHYRYDLERAAQLLRAAAQAAQNASLKDFLQKRSAAFLSNDYYASDVAWMDLKDSRIEPTIGPYEVYEDALFGYKAAFESFVTVADARASSELDGLKNRMPSLERNLPIEDRFKSLDRPFESPIRVVDVVYTSGDARRGVQTIAFNLPNDEKVIEAKGSKKVMLRNVMRAKFDKILTPIAGQVLESALVADVQFQPWFINVLMHELAHGLGPKSITTATGERTTVNRALKELYSAIEEAKADVTGLHNLTILQQQGVYDAAFVRRAYVGHLADLFRAVRFGTSEAHGKANLLQFNWLREKNVLRYDQRTGRFTAELVALINANRELATELLTLQALGSYERAQTLLSRYGQERPELKAALQKLTQVPVDIRPQHTVVEKMKSW
ncbi:MAG: dipeptidyl-peptidase 3 family protein [Longimicrobiales bacterium]